MLKKPKQFQTPCESDELEDSDDLNDDFFQEKYETVLKKMLKIINSFKHSSIMQEKLNNYSIDLDLKPLQLLTFCKTRWNSIYLGCQRFIELSNQIQKVIIDFNSSKPDSLKLTQISDDEIKILSDIVQSLAPVNAGVNSLCKENINLSEADKILQFIILKSKSQSNPFSKELLDNIRMRVESRRNKIACSMLTFLKPDYETNNLSYVSSYESVINLKKLYDRLYPDENFSEDVESITEEGVSENIEIELEKFISGNKKTTQTKKMKLGELLSSYSSTNQLSHPKIQNLFDSLMSVQPTSVNPERAFSIAGWFCSKLRNRMSDELLESLNFLKYNKN